jgi:hypothetical protein
LKRADLEIGIRVSDGKKWRTQWPPFALVMIESGQLFKEQDMKAKLMTGAIALSIMLTTAGCETLSDLTLSDPTNTPTPEPTPTLEASATSETALLPGGECPPLTSDVLDLMRELEGQMAQIRGLSPIAPVERELLTPDQLGEIVREEFLAEYSAEEAADDSLLLWLYGLVPAEFDLWELYADLWTEQVAGYYDDDVEQMYVVCGSGFNAPEQLTYGHEFIHVLQDQTYDIDEGLGYNDEQCDLDSERCAAISALIEGDATLAEEQWIRTYASPDFITGLLEFYNEYESPVYDNAPAFMQEDLLFPYTSGRNFVNALFTDGGWVAIDAAYQNPPVTTEQIMHPDRYPNDQPVFLEVPELSGILGDGWRFVYDGVWGEWFTLLMLTEFLPNEQSVTASMGWGGDYYLFYTDDAGQAVTVLVTQWDSIRDTQEFAAASSAYGSMRFGESLRTEIGGEMFEGEGVYAYFERLSNQTRWVIATTPGLIELALEGMVFPAPALAE